MSATAMSYVAGILLWGLVATILMTTILLGSQGLGLSRLSLPFLFGTVVTSRLRPAYLFGYALYALGGWLFAFLYAALFAALGHQSWWLGALLGALHGTFLLTALMHVPYIHPRMASEYDQPRSDRALEPPGFPRPALRAADAGSHPARAHHLRRYPGRRPATVLRMAAGSLTSGFAGQFMLREPLAAERTTVGKSEIQVSEGERACARPPYPETPCRGSGRYGISYEDFDRSVANIRTGCACRDRNASP